MRVTDYLMPGHSSLWSPDRSSDLASADQPELLYLSFTLPVHLCRSFMVAFARQGPRATFRTLHTNFKWPWMKL